MSLSKPAGRWIGFALSFVAVLPSLIWITLDRRAWPWDQAWYGEVSAQLFGTLLYEPGLWLSEMQGLLPSKPPLFAWLGQFFIPVGWLIGDFDFAGLLLSVVLQCSTLYLVFLTSRRLTDRNLWWAAFATLFVAAAPLFVGMSHQYIVEPLQILVVAASFLLALEAPRLPLARGVLLLIVLVVAGAGAKATTPVYCGLAWLAVTLVLLKRWRRGERPDFRDWSTRLLLLCILVVGALTANWYVANIANVLAHMQNATVSDVVYAYGSAGPVIEKLRFWLNAVGVSFSLLPQVFVAFLGLTILVFVWFAWRTGFGRRRSAQLSGGRYKWLVGLAAMFHVATLVLVLALQINEETRFLAPILPALALFAVSALRFLSARRLPLLLSTLMLAQLTLVHADALGVVQHRAATPWLLPLVSETSQREVAHDVVAASCPENMKLRYTVIGVEQPEMNANTISMYSARQRLMDGWRCYYTGLGYAETDAGRALQRIDDLDATFVLLPKAEKISKDPNFLNMTVKPVYDMVSRSNRYALDPQTLGDYQLWRRAP